MHLGALEAMRAAGVTPPVNLTFVFEGEEEYGSESLYTWIDQNQERLRADVAIISDTGFFEGNVPAITVSLRGLMYAQIDVQLSPVDLHSGTYGGTVQNPANALATIVAALKGPDGRILVPGFYDDVEPLTAADREAMAALAFDEEAYRAEIPVSALVGEAGWTVLENRGARPDAGRQRDVERVPGRGREDDHPCPCPREDLHAARCPPGAAQGVRGAAGVRRPDRPARRHRDDDLHPRRRSEPHAHGPPRDAGRGDGAAGGLRRGPRVHPRGRLDPGDRGLLEHARAPGRPARVRAARLQRPRARTSRSSSTTSSAARGSSCACGTSWRRSRADAAPCDVGDGRVLPKGDHRVAVRTGPGARMRHTTSQGRRTNGT